MEDLFFKLNSNLSKMGLEIYEYYEAIYLLFCEL
jgi:hypothetical protein